MLGIVLGVVAPLLIGALLALDRTSSVIGHLVELALFVSYVAFMVLLLPIWTTVGMRVRTAVVILASLEVLLALVLWTPASVWPAGWVSVSIALFLTCYFTFVVIYVQYARRLLPGTLDFVFPLHGGRYCVAQGGPAAVNPHSVVEAQRYAVDLVALNARLQRAKSWFPDDLASYVVYGAEVRSPCDGTVVELADDRPDNGPGIMDGHHPAGNHVVIQTGDARVLLAHLRQHGVVVRRGDTVRAGDLVGYVGNSGNTSEPHLHFHAERDGAGIPVSFGKRMLVRNDVIRMP